MSRSLKSLIQSDHYPMIKQGIKFGNCNIGKKDCSLIDITLLHITIRHIDILIICICVRKICPDAKKGSPGKSQNYPYREQPFRDISLCLKDEILFLKYCSTALSPGIKFAAKLPSLFTFIMTETSLSKSILKG